MNFDVGQVPQYVMQSRKILGQSKGGAKGAGAKATQGHSGTFQKAQSKGQATGSAAKTASGSILQQRSALQSLCGPGGT